MEEKEVEEQEKIVRVFVEGGLVTEVNNLPKGYNWKVIDYDCSDCNEGHSCGNCDKAKNCLTYVGSPTCKWILCREERERRKRKREEKKRLEAERKAELDKMSLSELVEQIAINHDVPLDKLDRLLELERKLTLKEEQPKK